MAFKTLNVTYGTRVRFESLINQFYAEHKGTKPKLASAFYYFFICPNFAN
jgi:hypothetical protein